MADFVGAIRSGEKMEYHTVIARSVVRLVEAADRSCEKAGGDHGRAGCGREQPDCRARPGVN